MRQNVFGTKNIDAPPPRLSRPQTSSPPETSETQHRTVPLQSFLALRDKKKSTKKRHILLLSKIFFDTRNQWHSRGFLFQFSRHWDKMFSAETFDTPPPRPSHPQKSSQPETFRNTAQNSSPSKFFRHCETKKVDKKSWNNPLKHKIFRYLKSVTP